jgi:hypothetical protein
MRKSEVFLLPSKGNYSNLENISSDVQELQAR